MTWNPGQTFGTNLYSTCVLDTLIGMTNITNKLAGYAQMRATLKVRVTAVGSTFHAGTLLVSWGCAGGDGQFGTAQCGISLQNMSQRTTLPCAYVSANDSGNYELSLPFRHINGYFDLTDTVTQYDKISFDVLNPLKWYQTTVAGVLTAPNVSVSIYAWFEDVQLFTPIPQSEMDGAVGHVGKRGAKPRGFASQFAHMALDAGLTAAGLGAPALAARGTPTIPVASVRQKCDSAVAADTLYAHSLVEDPIAPMSGTDPMDFRAIYTREAYLTQIAWADATSPSNLAFFPVSPFLTVSTGLTAGTNRTGGILLLPMGFVGAPFVYWRGSIKFRVQVVAPKMVRGVIRLQYLPRTYGTPAYTTESGDTYTITMDISEAGETEMVVPFCGKTPWLQCSFPVNSANLCTDLTGNGTFVISAVEPLVSNGVGVSVNVFVSGVDLEFANLCAGAQNPISNRFIVCDSAAYPQTLQLDVFRNIRDVAKVPSIALGTKSSLGRTAGMAGAYMVLRATPYMRGFTVPNGFADLSYLTPIAWYSAGFLARRGKYRLSAFATLVGDGTSATSVSLVNGLVRCKPMVGLGTGTYVDYVSLTDATLLNNVGYFGSGYHAFGSAELDGAITLDVPAYAMTEYVHARPPTAGPVGAPALAYLVPLGPWDSVANSFQMQHAIYESAADDFSLDQFQFVPILFTA